MDVTEPWDDIRAKIQGVVDRWAGGKVDVLVNNAGVGIAGLSEEGGYVDIYYLYSPLLVAAMIVLLTFTLTLIESNRMSCFR